MVEIEAGTQSNVVMQGGKSVAKSGASHMVDSVAVETVGCKGNINSGCRVSRLYLTATLKNQIK
jgi:hypothetical protein